MNNENLVKVMEKITESLPRQNNDAQEVAGSNDRGEAKKKKIHGKV